MKLRKKIKTYIANTLVATIVMSIVAPMGHINAWATNIINYREPAKIVFDTKDGPKLRKSSNGYQKSQETGLEGNAGIPLWGSSAFQGVDEEGETGSGNRPQLPKFESVNWAGYVFDGWYDENDNKLEKLPYAYPYKDVTTYTAKWIGNTTDDFTLKVMHYRDLRTSPADIWNLPDTNEVIKFRESTWNSSPGFKVGSPVSETYRRDIPGYKLASSHIKNNKIRKYGENTGEGTGDTVAELNGTTKALKGKMPNDHMIVAYKYIPDENKKFNYTVEYIAEDGTNLAVANILKKEAESEIHASPKNITAYRLKEKRVKQGVGDTDNLENAIYSVQKISRKTTTEELFDLNHNFSAKMPNQNLTVQYIYEVDPTYTTTIKVKTLDSNQQELIPLKSILHNPSQNPVVIDLVKKSGYLYPPNINTSGGISAVSIISDSSNPELKKLQFNADATGGEIDITYVQNLNDANIWARVSYERSANGTLVGDISPKSYKKDADENDTELRTPYDISKFTRDIPITPEPNPFYRFEGWFYGNGNGDKLANSENLGDGTTAKAIDLDGNKVLFASFVKDEAEWFSIKFRTEGQGNISGQTDWGQDEVQRGTNISSLNPNLNPTPNSSQYRFEGWYNETGDLVDINTITAQADQVYTAKFVSVVTNNSLSIPNVSGGVGSNGMGEIKVSGANVDRYYAVTDESGNIVAIKSGAEIQNNGFINLAPGEKYQVYELSDDQRPPLINIGGNISEIDNDKQSLPASVRVPAVTNPMVGNDPNDGSKKSLRVSPVAPNTMYAILDSNGNVVIPPDSIDGWVNPNGNELIFNGLNPNMNYTIVAKPSNNSDSPSYRIANGTSIFTLDNHISDNLSYTLYLANGTIEEVRRDGVIVDITESTKTIVKKGDRIKIKADNPNFNRWINHIGNVTSLVSTRAEQTIVMPAEDVVLEAVDSFHEPTATDSNAFLDYMPKTGDFAINPADNGLLELRDKLVNNAKDIDYIGHNIHVKYTVKFNVHPPTAPVSEAVKMALGDTDGLKIPWSLDIGLAREVAGINSDLVEGANGNTTEIDVLTKLNPTLLGGLDYKLYKVSSGVATDISDRMNFDINAEDSNFTGSFGFKANIGDTIVLIYYKAYPVTIIDTKTGNIDNFKVADGNSLEDTREYMGLHITDREYIDAVTGDKYAFAGLTRSANGTNLYDVASIVKGRLTLYAKYELVVDPAWQPAKDNLRNELNIAQALRDSGSISDEKREALQSAMDIALAVYNQLPRPTVEELERAYETLHNAIEIARQLPPTNIPDTEPTPNSNENSNRIPIPLPNGSNKSGGGGAGGTRSRSTGGTTSMYVDSIDGNWNLIDPINHIWRFDLTSGTNSIKDKWAKIMYIHNGVQATYTYHFDKDGKMSSGWILDKDNQWYYLSTEHNGWFGSMVKGWIKDSTDSKWYYLNHLTGSMLKGWQEIDGRWYYFTKEGENLPLGSLLTNTITPDGYAVDANGEWIRETP